MAQEQRKFEQAEQYYQQALQIKIEYNDRYNQASTYHQLGIVAQEQRSSSRPSSTTSRPCSSRSSSTTATPRPAPTISLGSVAQEQRKFEQAQQYYQQALQLYIEYNDRYEQARTYHQLGIVAQEQRKFEQAEQYYQQALQISIEYDDRYEQASTYHQLGRVAEEQRQWDKAREYFLRALETYVAYQDSENGSIVVRSLARLGQTSGDTGLPTVLAPVLGMTPPEAEALLRSLRDKEPGQSSG